MAAAAANRKSVSKVAGALTPKDKFKQSIGKGLVRFAQRHQELHGEAGALEGGIIKGIGTFQRLDVLKKAGKLDTLKSIQTAQKEAAAVKIEKTDPQIDLSPYDKESVVQREEQSPYAKELVVRREQQPRDKRQERIQKKLQLGAKRSIQAKLLKDKEQQVTQSNLKKSSDLGANYNLSASKSENGVTETVRNDDKLGASIADRQQKAQDDKLFKKRVLEILEEYNQQSGISKLAALPKKALKKLAGTVLSKVAGKALAVGGLVAAGGVLSSINNSMKSPTLADAVPGGGGLTPVGNKQTGGEKVSIRPTDLPFTGITGKFIAQEEGVMAKAYDDGAGYPTIGVGHMITKAEIAQGYISVGSEKVPIDKNNVMATTMTKEQIVTLFEKDDLPRYEEMAKRQLGSAWGKLNEAQKAAVVSYTFNAGEGSQKRGTGLANLVKKGLVEKIEAGDMAGAANLLANGVQTAKGVVMAGLSKRRAREAELFKNGVKETATKSDSKTGQAGPSTPGAASPAGSATASTAQSSSSGASSSKATASGAKPTAAAATKSTSIASPTAAMSKTYNKPATAATPAPQASAPMAAKPQSAPKQKANPVSPRAPSPAVERALNKDR